MLHWKRSIITDKTSLKPQLGSLQCLQLVSEDSCSIHMCSIPSICAVCSLHIMVEQKPYVSIKEKSRTNFIFPYHFPILVEYFQNFTLILFCLELAITCIKFVLVICIFLYSEIHHCDMYKLIKVYEDVGGQTFLTQRSLNHLGTCAVLQTWRAG